MTSRVFLGGVTLFWIGMNVLLWRAEYGSARMGASPIAPELVLDRILTSADPSTLRVLYQGGKVGVVRWMPTILEASPATSGRGGEIEVVEGMVREATGYRLDVDFSRQADDLMDRWRMFLQVELSTNRTLRTLQFRLQQRPAVWEVEVSAAGERVVVRMKDGERMEFEQTMRAGEMGGLPGLLGPYGAFLPRGMGLEGLTRVEPGGRDPITWDAAQDRLTIGQHAVRVYRLRARLLETYEAVAWVSRAGELLRIEVGDQLVMVNNEVPGLAD